MMVKAFLRVAVFSVTLGFAEQSVTFEMLLDAMEKSSPKLQQQRLQTKIAQDTNFTSLKVWQDTNQDGISQNSELKTLTELGITEIRTASTPVTSSGDLIVSNETLFTCKTFTIQKALHVKTNIEPKEANDGAKNKVA